MSRGDVRWFTNKTTVGTGESGPFRILQRADGSGDTGRREGLAQVGFADGADHPAQTARVAHQSSMTIGVWFTYQVGYLPNIPLITKLFIRLSNISTSADFTIVNSEIESTVRVVAHPGLVMNRSPIPTIVRQRKQYAFFAFQTRCKLMFHPIPPIHLSDRLQPQTAEELCKRTTQNKTAPLRGQSGQKYRPARKANP